MSKPGTIRGALADDHHAVRQGLRLLLEQALDIEFAGEVFLVTKLKKGSGGERGIRTLGGRGTHLGGLANHCFRPLSHLSAVAVDTFRGLNSLRKEILGNGLT
tara:strand:+ start:2678 stop:2986 length:309 start_codon:yes stop_codon:yes gene_type:complete